jgi:hypothetical protein
MTGKEAEALCQQSLDKRSNKNLSAFRKKCEGRAQGMGGPGELSGVSSCI